MCSFRVADYCLRLASVAVSAASTRFGHQAAQTAKISSLHDLSLGGFENCRDLLSLS